jgi:hypothetical protein
MNHNLIQTTTWIWRFRNFSLLRQGRVQDALKWLDGEYLTENALSEIDDEGLRKSVLEELNRSNVQEKAQFI